MKEQSMVSWLRKAGVATLASVCLLFGMSQTPTYGWMYDWTNLSSRVVVDPSGDQTLFDGAADILKVWASYSYNGTNFLRMDLRSTPGLQNGGPIYGVYLDTQSGGATNSTSNYVPVGLGGIENIVDSHFDSTEPIWTLFHFHTYTNNPIFARISLTSVQHSESGNGGASLEWAIPSSLIGTDDFTFYGGVSVLGYNESVYDLAGVPVIPEPSAWTLVGLALVPLFFRRSRKSC